jgi:hypothetical protein
VAPIVAEAMRELLASTIDRAVSDAISAAVSAAVPPAVLEAVRIEAGGQVRQTVIETSERLVREEIERIRERRTK